MKVIASIIATLLLSSTVVIDAAVPMSVSSGEVVTTPSVGRLSVDLDNDGDMDGSSSYVVYKQEENRYYAITCYHCVQVGTLYADVFLPTEMVYALGSFVRLETRLEGADRDLDLAVISFTTDLLLAPAKLSEKLPPSFTPVFALGCPLGGCVTLTSGYFCNIINSNSASVTAPIINGNSGGAVLDGRTLQLIGITKQIQVVGVRSFAGVHIPVTHLQVIIPSTVIIKWLEQEKLQ